MIKKIITILLCVSLLMPAHIFTMEKKDTESTDVVEGKAVKSTNEIVTKAVKEITKSMKTKNYTSRGIIGMNLLYYFVVTVVSVYDDWNKGAFLLFLSGLCGFAFLAWAQELYITEPKTREINVLLQPLKNEYIQPNDGGDIV